LQQAALRMFHLSTLKSRLSTPPRQVLSLPLLTSPLQLTENTATSSPAFATLTHHVNRNPFLCHSYRKHPGVGSHLSNERVRSFPESFSDHDSRNTNRNSRPLLATRHSPPACPECSRIATKPFGIRTYKKRACNFFRIRTSKTQDLKSFRIRTYEKRPGGGAQ
jgi:hypothetical protein